MFDQLFGRFPLHLQGCAVACPPSRVMLAGPNSNTMHMGILNHHAGRSKSAKIIAATSSVLAHDSAHYCIRHMVGLMVVHSRTLQQATALYHARADTRSATMACGRIPVLSLVLGCAAACLLSLLGATTPPGIELQAATGYPGAMGIHGNWHHCRGCDHLDQYLH